MFVADNLTPAGREFDTLGVDFREGQRRTQGEWGSEECPGLKYPNVMAYYYQTTHQNVINCSSVNWKTLRAIKFTNVIGAMGSLVVRTSDSRPEALVPCLNWGGGDRWCRHLSSLLEFHQANSYCHLYGAQGQRQADI
ncbi:hypothetical protein TNCV_4581221 [Trichonephila clavipes]|nr:hypothetical protein TNCV_4581221 [Trichonephila clavipes]